MFEEPSSPSLVMPAEVAEAEGLVTKPNHSTTNKWGPIVYNRDHHPLHIMVKILSSIITHVYAYASAPTSWQVKKQNSLISSVSGLDSDSLGGFAD